MNVLKRDKKVLVVSMLADGMSVRAVQRVLGVHPVTTLRLLNRVGDYCQSRMDEYLTDLCVESLELDEAWSFVFKKERNRQPGESELWGDQYVFVAQDSLTKVIPCFHLGRRDYANTAQFLKDLTKRVVSCEQVSTDGFGAYRHLVPQYFGRHVAFMQIIKKYAADHDAERRYSPPRVAGVDRVWVQGMPRGDRACTSHVEAQNVGLRTHCKRLSRLTLCFSKKWENLLAALRLHFAAFNFVRKHQSLGMAPALSAGIIGSGWTMADLVP